MEIIILIPTSVGRVVRIIQTDQEDRAWLKDWPDSVSPRGRVCGTHGALDHRARSIWGTLQFCLRISQMGRQRPREEKGDGGRQGQL